MDDGQSFAFGEFRFSDRRKELSRNGATLPLGSRALDLLGYLLRHAGQTIGKDALMMAVWPGRVVDEHNLAVQLSALRRALDDVAAGARFIQTDTGRGYRFIAPVVRISDPEAPSEAKPRAGETVAASLQKPSIAILPFDNMSPDPEHTYFADGMVEDITTELSRSRSLLVISRGASFMYRGKTQNLRQVAAELGVRYVLEGSVRASASRVRVNAQLIDTGNVGHIWAERYDRDIVDMFAVQDEITRAVTMAIEPAVQDAEQVRANRVLAENLGAWEAFHRGMWCLDRMDPESNGQAREYFELAITRDPGFAPPHAWLVQTWLNEIYVFFAHERAGVPGLAARATQHALRAVALDADDAAGHAALAWAAYMSGDPAGGVARAEKALALNPNHVEAYRALAQNLVWLDRMVEARDALLLCLRLCPRGSRNWLALHQLTAIHYLLGDYDAAAAAGLSVRDVRPSAVAHRWLIAALGQLGRIDEAAAAMRTAAELLQMPFDDYARFQSPSVRDHHHAHMHEGLRLARWDG